MVGPPSDQKDRVAVFVFFDSVGWGENPMWDKLPFYALVTVLLGAPIFFAINYLIATIRG